MVKQGDRVKFISDITVGVVVSINGGMANVMIEDGFEIPTMITDLVVVEQQEETSAMRKMGVSQGTAVNTNVKGNTPKDKKVKQPQRTINQYGKISLEDVYEDEEPLDLSYLKSNYIKKSIATNSAEIKKEEARVKAIPSPIELTEYEVKLCFVPDNISKPEESLTYKLFLVNDSSYEVFYSISKWSNSNYVNAISSGKMQEDSKEEILTFKREQLATVSKLSVNLMFFKPITYVPQPSESFSLELSPMKFVRRGNYVINDYFDEAVVMFTIASSSEIREVVIDEKQLAQSIREKEDVKIIPAKRTGNEPEIIDLHAEEILDNINGMTSGEILKAQLSRFEIVMDLAVNNNRGGKIVFIHGIGSGKLKYEMKKLLDSKYSRVKYQDASFKEYGYGAIMVFFK